MLFNSYVFLFAFLPVVYAGYLLLLRRARREVMLGWLVAASLVYYGWASANFLVIFVASIAANGIFIRLLIATTGLRLRRAVLAGSIVFNLGLLGYHKYWAFFLSHFTGVVDQGDFLVNVALPIGISFYTFQQIAYLVDSYRSRVSHHSFLNHALFVSFFPQLIAGPIVHHREMMPQFEDPPRGQILNNLTVGLSIFAIGLFKKTVLADGIAPWADPVFDQAASGAVVPFAVAWTGALAYTFQLYFDFSGYSDMAIGLARMFGIVLPLNFFSPYKAASIIEFWRRWHITLSRFLRDYLYIPLGGNRRGPVRRHANLLVTMLLGGLWHGAGWSFVLWGGIHGVLLVLNHGWVALRRRWGLDRAAAHPAYRAVAVAATFILVVTAWVPFRSPDLATSFSLLKSMYGIHGGSVADSLWDSYAGLRNAVLGLADILRVALSDEVHDVARFQRNLGIAGPGLWDLSVALGVDRFL